LALIAHGIVCKEIVYTLLIQHSAVMGSHQSVPINLAGRMELLTGGVVV